MFVICTLISYLYMYINEKNGSQTDTLETFKLLLRYYITLIHSKAIFAKGKVGIRMMKLLARQKETSTQMYTPF